MREEYHAMREVGALSICASEFSQANIIQYLVYHQEKLTQDLNLQLASTM